MVHGLAQAAVPNTDIQKEADLRSVTSQRISRTSYF